MGLRIESEQDPRRRPDEDQDHDRDDRENGGPHDPDPANDPRAELRGIIQVGKGLASRDRDSQERTERFPAVSDVKNQEALGWDDAADLFVMPVEDVQREGPVIEPPVKRPVPDQPIEHAAETAHSREQRCDPARECLADIIDRMIARCHTNARGRAR